MYLNPPCNNLQEFKERHTTGELFRVFKRRVNLRTRDASFKDQGYSTVTMADGTEVYVFIFNGRVKEINPPIAGAVEIPEKTFTTTIAPRAQTDKVKDITFKEMLASMQRMEKEYTGKKIEEERPTREEELQIDRVVEEEAWNEVLTALDINLKVGM